MFQAFEQGVWAALAYPNGQGVYSIARAQSENRKALEISGCILFVLLIRGNESDSPRPTEQLGWSKISYATLGVCKQETNKKLFVLLIRGN